MSDICWTASYGRACKRSRKNALKDAAGIGLVHKRELAIFDTEIEAVAYILGEKKERLRQCEAGLSLARQIVKTWERRLGALSAEADGKH